jgi:oligoendopeptidase F
MGTNALPPRSEVDPRVTWNAESVFPNAAAWEAEIAAIQAALPGLTAFAGSVGEDARHLLPALGTRDALLERSERVLVYAAFLASVDTANSESNAMAGRARLLGAEVRAAASFLFPEILAIGQDRLQKWMAGERRLAVYRHHFDNLFRQGSHVRSAEVEQILGMLSDPFSGATITASLLTNSDLRFPPGVDRAGESFDVTQGTLMRLLANPDRRLRQTSWENYIDRYVEFKNTLASALSTSIRQFVLLSRVRGHSSSLDASLHENDIPVSVYHNLVDVFRSRLPIWHRYFALRRRLLGVDKLEHFDLWAPLTSNPVKITYPEAVEMICAGLAPMGKEYVATVRRGCVEERWIDVYPNQGKRGGAFSWGARGTHPFVMLSYNDTVFSLSTLAHELGHSMHSYLTWKHQPQVYSDYSLFLAEVASNFHQAMVRGHLLRTVQDREFQIAVIEEAMANFLRYFFIMPTLARFELATHGRVESGQALAAEWMSETCADLFAESYGEGVHVDRQRVGMLWATYGHMYSDFYVYQYSTGIAGAEALSRRILDGVPGAVEDYLGFLKAGASDYPLELLRRAGVDLSRPKPIERAFQVMEEYVDRLDKLAPG